MESKIKLLDQMRLVLRLKHMSIRTEDTYVHWVKRFILFHHTHGSLIFIEVFEIYKLLNLLKLENCFS